MLLRSILPLLSCVAQGSQFRFHYSEFHFFDQSLTFILLNLKPKSQTFRTEIRIPVFTENEKNHRNFGLSDRKGEPWCRVGTFFNRF